MTESNKKRKLKWFIMIAAIAAIAVLVIVLAVSNSPSQRVAKLLDLGQKYLEDGEYEEAIAAFEEVLEIDPKCVEAYLGEADAYVALDDYDSATAVLEKGYELTGDARLTAMLDSLETAVIQREEDTPEIGELRTEEAEEEEMLEPPVSSSASRAKLEAAIDKEIRKFHEMTIASQQSEVRSSEMDEVRSSEMDEVRSSEMDEVKSSEMDVNYAPVGPLHTAELSLSDQELKSIIADEVESMRIFVPKEWEGATAHIYGTYSNTELASKDTEVTKDESNASEGWIFSEGVHLLNEETLIVGPYWLYRIVLEK